jgi:hypothetical protein
MATGACTYFLPFLPLTGFSKSKFHSNSYSGTKSAFTFYSSLVYLDSSYLSVVDYSLVVYYFSFFFS